MRKTHPFRFCGTNGFLLVEAPPQAPCWTQSFRLRLRDFSKSLQLLISYASLHSRLNRTRKALAFRWMCCPLSIDICPQYAIIQPNKMQTPIKPQLDKRLHFPFLKKGAVPSATNYPPDYNCTLIISYRTGGNNQLGPQEKAHQQFRYSAARNRAHRPVHSPWHPRLLRKWRRPAGVPGMAGSAWSGTDGRKGRDKQISDRTGCRQLGGTFSHAKGTSTHAFRG